MKITFSHSIVEKNLINATLPCLHNVNLNLYREHCKKYMSRVDRWMDGELDVT